MDERLGIGDFPSPLESLPEAWCGERTAYPRESTIHEVFAEISRDCRDRVAVRQGEDCLTYGELERESSAFADRLRLAGIGSGDLVGIVPERRVELAVGLLGILKAGAAYVPLDTAYPVERLAFMIEDTGIEWVIGEALTVEVQERQPGFIDWQGSITERATTARSSSVPAAAAKATAYIMYTSGSTGRPKGTVVPHRAVLRLVLGQDYVQLGPDHRILQYAPVAFDASTLEIWGALLSGAELVLMPTCDPSLRALGGAIADHGITTMWLTAGLFHAMVDERPEDLCRLQQLLTGGDVVSPARAAKLLNMAPHLTLINGYGPTENTTFTCCHRITLEDAESGNPLPIGRPIPNTSTYILGEDLRPVAPGEEGELCTGGDGLADGYWNRPDLTNDRFIDAPWDRSTRLYRTGDLARFRPDGVIEFLGRRDQQVKIRGFRIELNEIETAIESLPDVKQAAVIARSPGQGTEKVLEAFFVAAHPLDRKQVLAHLGERLPSYMVPSLIQQLDEIPLTTNGKVDRRALPGTAESPAVAADSTGTSLPDVIECTLVEVLGTGGIPRDTNFFDLGVSSLHVARAHEKLQAQLGREFPITDFFQFTTVNRLAEHLGGAESKPMGVDKNATDPNNASGMIAVVGLAGRFPGAPDVDTFWENLCAGRETISHFTEGELDFSNATAPGAVPNARYVRSRSIIGGVELFDARHFGIPPKEAELLDPQHRILLECAQEALEHAGCDPDRYSGKIGFFAGSSQNSYLLNNLCRDREFVRDLAAGYPVNNFSVMFGNDKDFLPTRVAYKLNLRGQAAAIQCACSTSLVAVAEACKNLQSGHCDMALAGGVSLTFPQKRDYLYTPDGMASEDGHCRTFDKDATGTVFGEGAGLVALKRFEDAQADGDDVLAVIRGFALNNDAADKAGYAAPSVNGQAAVIAEAQASAGVSADSISYVEAHGTGTPLGDPIEIAALKQAFARSTDRKQFCAIGTAKTNVGHLDIAAGVTGLIKTVLSLHHRRLPPLLHYKEPNPKIDFANSPFYPLTEMTSWEKGASPRRAGISAFGVGGTNVHMILEEAPERETSGHSTGLPQIYPVSGTCEAAVKAGLEQLGEFARRHPDACCEEVSAALQFGRRQFARRAFVVAEPGMEKLSVASAGERRVFQSNSATKNVCFLFPGQGSQHPGMGREAYETFAVFRDAVDSCAEILVEPLGEDIRELIYPGADCAQEAASRLKNTSLAQPAIFSIEYATMCQWHDWGIEPSCMAGHSIGEFAAACTAGVFALEDALALIALRGKLMGQLPGGAMVSVRLPEAETLQRIADFDLDLAAVNGATACVVAGAHDAANAFSKAMDTEGVVVKPLHTSHAFHSRMMDPIVPEFEEAVRKVELRAPSIPILSTVTNAWMTAEDATNPHYWSSHLRKPVRFFAAAEQLWKRADTLLLEVGPGRTLATLAGQNPDKESPQAALASLPHPSSSDRSDLQMLNALGELWARGLSVDWQRFHGGSRPRLAKLPPYPFQRKRFWVEPAESALACQAPQTPPATAPIASTLPMMPMPPAAISPPLQSPLTQPPHQVMNETESCGNPQDAILAELKNLLSDLSGIEPSEMDGSASFLELGFDSLLLTQAGKELKDAFGVNVTLRQLIDEFPNLNALCSYLEANADPAKLKSAAPAAPAGAPPAPAAAAALPQTQPYAVAADQMQAYQSSQSPHVPPGYGYPPVQMPPMHPMMYGYPYPWMPMSAPAPAPNPMMVQPGMPMAYPPVPMPAQAPAPQQAPAATPAPTPAPTPAVSSGGASESIPAQEVVKPEETSPKKFGPSTVIEREKSDDALSASQRAFLDDLVTRYNERTPKSKSLTQQYRRWHADPRTASGFNRAWKEMVYQIITVKSKGSRLLDIDGNEYIDILNGFGPGFLGHSPGFIVEALKEQIDRGFEVGPNCLLALEAAQLFCEVTGNERASFVNTGSEAVQAAMRLARTVTGRDKIVIFARDYHGNFDEVLVRGANRGKDLKTLPVAPGIPRRATGDMIVLPYGTDESLEIIKEHADELAAVIVEPVQSRRPEFQPREFIREIREVTRNSGALFVFDEVVTGFRSGPKGAQEFYGVDADLATYGKVVGGGMPLGVVAGKAEFMDTFDGGMWSYGDESFPEKPVTFFAGTFVRHPLAMASVKAMLEFFKEQTSHFWAMMNAKGNKLAKSVDAFFKENSFPVEMPNFGSLMFVRMGDEKFGNLLFYNLRAKGVFMLEGFPSYVTCEHSDDDLDYCIDAFKQSAMEMREAGFFAEASGPCAAPGERLTGPPRQLSAASEANPSPEARPAKHEAKKHRSPLRVSTTEPQREIYLASRLSDASSCAFNESASLTFDGELDAEKLEAAFREVVNRHDCLRATFTEDGAEMLVHPEANVPFRRIDVDLETWIKNDASEPFDLANGPVIRASLISPSPAEHVLVITGHHIVLDGWSFNVIAEELSVLYNAAVRGEAHGLPVPKPFAEYALEEAGRVRSEEHRGQEEFWLERFADLPEPIELPLDRLYPADRTYQGDSVEHRINRETYEAIKKTGAKHGCTLYTTLGAAFQLLMHRLTGQNDLVVGIPAAGQNDGTNTEYLVGHCVHFLPLRSRIQGTPQFSEFLAGARQTILAATDNRGYTYGELIQKLDIERDPRRMPLLEVAFNVERMDYFGEWEGMQARFEPNGKTFVHYGLFMNIVESKDGLRIDTDYNTDVLDRDTVVRWVHAFEHLIEGIVANPAAGIFDLPMMSAAESEQVLVDFNASGCGNAPTECVHSLFEECARANTKSTALIFRSGDSSALQSMTYGELDERAEILANWLADQGVGRGSYVTVFCERCPDLVAALLGILKAGAAYVPIDPSYPKDRIAYMIEDTKSEVMITQSNLKDRLPESGDGDAAVICLDQDWPLVGQRKALDSGCEDTAYVIYTSGSTGRPKGTVIPHRGITRLVRDTNYLDFSPEQTFLMAAPVSFDASTLELWGPLLNGGRLAIPPAGTPGLQDIGEAVSDFGVTTLWLTAGLFQLMVDERLEDLRSVRQLLAGGDVLPKEQVRKALGVMATGARLINGYGPTENTTFTTCHTICPEDLERPSIPIGRPIAHTQVYILDEQMRPVPVGVRGQLYIGGAGLAKGYHRRPDLTAEKFVPNPFSDCSDAKLYASGDICRWLPDGTIEFFGRGDKQVKIRGFRIEPGEVEDALATLPKVAQAIVVVRGDSASNKVLVAYVTPAEGASLDESVLRRHVGESLPAYMAPAAYVVLDQLPVTANGKIDYRALPEPSAEARADSDFAAPESPLEKRVAALWRDVLGVERVGRDDDFFSIGGHSLKGLQLFTRIQKELGIALPLATLIKAPTVAQLAAILEPQVGDIVDDAPEEKAVETIQTVATFRGSGEQTPLFCVHGGDGGVLFYKDFFDQLPAGRALHAIEAPMLLDPTKSTPEATVEDTARLYLSGLEQTIGAASCILCGYSFGGVVAFEMAQQLAAAGRTPELLVLFDTPNPAREYEFRNGVLGRVAANWSRSESEGVLGRIKGLGERLTTGVASKMEHHSKVSETHRRLEAAEQLTDEQRLMHIRESHDRLSRAYEPNPYPGTVLLLRATEVSDRYSFNEAMGWDNVIEDLHIADIPGEHEQIFYAPHYSELARVFLSELARIEKTVTLSS